MEMGRKVRGGVEPQVKERSFGSEKEVVWALYHYMYMSSGRKVFEKQLQHIRTQAVKAQLPLGQLP